MLSLDMRMVGLHAPSRASEAAPLLGGAPSSTNLMTTYSPVTPVELKFMFDYESGLLSTPGIARGAAYGSGSDCDGSGSGSSVDLDFAHELPALSVGDSCSDAHSPATSWTEDSLARTSPDPPAYEVAAREWGQFAFAAHLPVRLPSLTALPPWSIRRSGPDPHLSRPK